MTSPCMQHGSDTYTTVFFKVRNLLLTVFAVGFKYRKTGKHG